MMMNLFDRNFATAGKAEADLNVPVMTGQDGKLMAGLTQLEARLTDKIKNINLKPKYIVYGNMLRISASVTQSQEFQILMPHIRIIHPETGSSKFINLFGITNYATTEKTGTYFSFIPFNLGDVGISGFVQLCFSRTIISTNVAVTLWIDEADKETADKWQMQLLSCKSIYRFEPVD